MKKRRRLGDRRRRPPPATLSPSSIRARIPPTWDLFLNAVSAAKHVRRSFGPDAAVCWMIQAGRPTREAHLRWSSSTVFVARDRLSRSAASSSSLDLFPSHSLSFFLSRLFQPLSTHRSSASAASRRASWSPRTRPLSASSCATSSTPRPSATCR